MYGNHSLVKLWGDLANKQEFVTAKSHFILLLSQKSLYTFVFNT